MTVFTFLFSWFDHYCGCLNYQNFSASSNIHLCSHFNLTGHANCKAFHMAFSTVLIFEILITLRTDELFVINFLTQQSPNIISILNTIIHEYWKKLLLSLTEWLNLTWLPLYKNERRCGAATFSWYSDTCHWSTKVLPTTYIIGGKQLLYTQCLARFFIKDVAAAAVVLVGNLIICPCFTLLA